MAVFDRRIDQYLEHYARKSEAVVYIVYPPGEGAGRLIEPHVPIGRDAVDKALSDLADPSLFGYLPCSNTPGPADQPFLRHVGHHYSPDVLVDQRRRGYQAIGPGIAVLRLGVQQHGRGIFILERRYVLIGR